MKKDFNLFSKICVQKKFLLPQLFFYQKLFIFSDLLSDELSRLLRQGGVDEYS